MKICARYCGTTILLAEFNDRKQAEEFMKHDFVMNYYDEFDNIEDDEIIHANEMFIDEEDEEIPFSDPVVYEWDDDLPF